MILMKLLRVTFVVVVRVVVRPKTLHVVQHLKWGGMIPVPAAVVKNLRSVAANSIGPNQYGNVT